MTRIIITYPGTLKSLAGGPRHCLQLAEHLTRAGADVLLMPVSRDAGEPGPRVRPVPPSRIHYLLDGRAIARAVRTELDAGPVDAVLGWETEAAFLPGALRGRATLFGIIAAFPSYALWASRPTPLRLLKRATDAWFRARPMRRADVVFASSRFTRDELVALFGIDPAKIVVAPLGTDERFARIPRAAPSEISRLLFFGTLAPVKGVRDAVCALGRVARGGRRAWTLRVAGWGDPDPVRRAAEEEGIADRVEMLGALGRDQLVPQLEWAQLAVLPSHAESFGLSIAEAQAAALPVVAYDAAAVPEVVESGRTGWLAPKGDVERLAAAIEEAMADPAEAHRRGTAGRERIAAAFDWPRTASTMLTARRERRLG